MSHSKKKKKQRIYYFQLKFYKSDNPLLVYTCIMKAMKVIKMILTFR